MKRKPHRHSRESKMKGLPVAYILSFAVDSLAFVTPFTSAGGRPVNHQQHQQQLTPPSSSCLRSTPAPPTAISTGETRTGRVDPTATDDPLISRRSLLLREGIAAIASTAALVATAAGAVSAITAHPAPAIAKPQRIKGGGPLVTLDSGAQYQEMTIGDGAAPKDGDRVAVHFSLYYNGLEVESSRDSQGLAARPLGYTCGNTSGPGSVPPGLDEVVKGMRVGGRRKVTLPPQLAFGEEGRPPFIPAGATVQFDVSLWSVKPEGRDPNITLPGSSVF